MRNVPALPYETAADIERKRARLRDWQIGDRLEYVSWHIYDILPMWLRKQADIIYQQLYIHTGPDATPEQLYRCRCDQEKIIHQWVHTQAGAALFRKAPLRQCVEDALWQGAGRDYELYDYVIMPNHVHLLLEPLGGSAELGTIVGGIKQATTDSVNARLSRQGLVWSLDWFGVRIRCLNHLQKVQNYIYLDARRMADSEFTLHTLLRERNGSGGSVNRRAPV